MNETRQPITTHKPPAPMERDAVGADVDPPPLGTTDRSRYSREER